MSIVTPVTTAKLPNDTKGVKMILLMLSRSSANQIPVPTAVKARPLPNIPHPHALYSFLTSDQSSYKPHPQILLQNPYSGLLFFIEGLGGLAMSTANLQ